MTDADAVVVGAGPNGLVAAIVLAEAGLRTILFEAASRPGGALRTEELTLPGFRHDVGATVHALALASPAFRALQLERDGLAFAHPALPLGHALAPGRSVLLDRDPARTAEGLGVDGPRWNAVLGGFARKWEGVASASLDLTRIPPEHPATLIDLGLHGAFPATFPIRRVFRDDPARALFAGLAVHAGLPLTALGSAAFGIVLGSLAHGVGWPVAVGGSERVAEALVERFTTLGGEIITGRRIRSLDELPAAGVTILDVDARQFARLAGDRLPPGYRRRLERWRTGPGVFKVDWALDAAIPWADEALSGAGTVHLGGSAETVIASEAAAHRGAVSGEPYVLLVQPTVADATRAPAGKHTAWAYIHVPNGWDGDATGLIERRIESFAPGFRDRILARHAFSPAALEAWDANLVGGDIGGGANDWRQLFARPRAALAPWRTPIPGVWLASASTLPGGGAHGMAGWNAAHDAVRRAGSPAHTRRVQSLA
ncbi:phytoene desaturase family protein [Microbacterium sp. ASV49]|uniref:NAD(P)/FAD-dependent oxidoreductase n=1 Tax=Microbacterium candidum TaxID=3041922 RepID=A0ABT7N2D0_9MICO|nr:NAD(P)/FAD-dependent oxidoreductase [Microbacterium sp. ASV49]MDL9980858.1 NAD(P)/FAD-dependent oxidoreductase [Microbacterium sp. ASV49]